MQRYWDGYRWAAQRVWNGAQWMDTPLGTPPPVIPLPLVPPPATAPTRRRHIGLWIAAAAFVAVAVVVAALAATSDGTKKGTGSVAAHTPRAAARVIPGASSSAAGAGNSIRAWEHTQNESGRTNAQILNTVERDIATIGNDFSSQADSTTVETDCAQLSQDLVQSQPTDSPDPSVNGNLKKAFDYLVSGSVDCGADDQAAATELNKAIDYLNTATGEIKSLGG